MADQAEKFRLVQEPDDPAVAGQTVEPAVQKIAADALFLALRTLSQKSLVAIASLFTLITVGSAFWLALSIHDPNTYQLVELGGYFLFVLAANWIVRRK
jgi:hypothetical protein